MEKQLVLHHSYQYSFDEVRKALIGTGLTDIPAEGQCGFNVGSKPAELVKPKDPPHYVVLTCMVPVKDHDGQTLHHNFYLTADEIRNALRLAGKTEIPEAGLISVGVGSFSGGIPCVNVNVAIPQA